MRSRIVLPATLFLVAVFTSASAHAQAQAAQAGHEHTAGTAAAVEQQHAGMTAPMMDMTAADQKIDALVKKMNAAKGSAKTDAIAELVTALVESQRAMHAMMMPAAGNMPMENMPMTGNTPMDMSSMMNMCPMMMMMMHGSGAAPVPPEK